MTTCEAINNMYCSAQENASRLEVGTKVKLSYEEYRELKLFNYFSLFEAAKDVFVIKQKDIPEEEAVQIECIKEIKWDKNLNQILHRYSFGKYLLDTSPLVLPLEHFQKWEYAKDIPSFYPSEANRRERILHVYAGTKPSLWSEGLLRIKLKRHLYQVKQVHKKGFYRGMKAKDVASLSAYDRLKLANRLNAIDAARIKKNDETRLGKIYKNLK